MSFVRQLLQGKPADVWTVEPQTTVYRCLEIMADKNVGALPVVREGHVVGMFSERDYARKVILKGKSSHALAVKDVMSQPVFCVGPDDSAETCMHLMTEQRIRHLPVIEQDRLIGMVSIGDVLKARIADQQVLIQDLQNYITSGRS